MSSINNTNSSNRTTMPSINNTNSSDRTSMSYTNDNNSSINNKNQTINTEEKIKTKGGYMGIKHEVEEQTYGPKSPFEIKFRLFLCIRHMILRDWERTYLTQEKLLPHKKIMASIGLKDKSNFNKYVKYLIDNKMISIRVAEEGVYYSLDPERFGRSYIPEMKIRKKHLGLIDQESSLIDQEPSPIDHPPLCEATTVAPSQKKNSLKNLYQEPIKNLSHKKGDEFDKSNWEEVRERLIELNPGEENKIDKIYRELKSKGVDDRGKVIQCLPALMLSSYVKLKKSREIQIVSQFIKINRSEQKEDQPVVLEELSPFWSKFALRHLNEKL